MFDERAAIHLRMQQIVQERERLQDEYKDLFTRLREMDQREDSQIPSPPVESVRQNNVATQEKQLEWENIDLGDQVDAEIDTKEYDERLNQLQDFLESEE
ncbi:hypothetical protein ACFFH4_25975 [Halalkalibacter alkalisediminis]|uniref:Rok N-terminal oligomerisation domain-containing protein n=1 Tax=Halalkalibacter alkalisediminis TaxID=935616 RepID=A0ABV6NNG4_9BACI